MRQIRNIQYEAEVKENDNILCLDDLDFYPFSIDIASPVVPVYSICIEAHSMEQTWGNKIVLQSQIKGLIKT